MSTPRRVRGHVGGGIIAVWRLRRADPRDGDGSWAWTPIRSLFRSTRPLGPHL